MNLSGMLVGLITSVVLMNSPATGWPGGAQPSADAARAADITLFVLQAASDPHDPTKLPEFPGLTFASRIPMSDARDVLANIPKPVACVASVTDGMFFVSCRPLSIGENEEHVIAANRVGQSIRNALQVLCGNQNDPLIEFRPLSDTVKVQGPRLFKASTFQAWLRRYRVSYGSRVDAPDDVALGEGACAVIRIGRPLSVVVPNDLFLRNRRES